MKGVTGKVLTIVITLVITVLALAILVLFYNKSIPFITDLVQNIIDGMKSWMCQSVWGPIKGVPLIGESIVKMWCG